MRTSMAITSARTICCATAGSARVIASATLTNQGSLSANIIRVSFLGHELLEQGPCRNPTAASELFSVRNLTDPAPHLLFRESPGWCRSLEHEEGKVDLKFRNEHYGALR